MLSYWIDFEVSCRKSIYVNICMNFILKKNWPKFTLVKHIYLLYASQPKSLCNQRQTNIQKQTLIHHYHFFPSIQLTFFTCVLQFMCRTWFLGNSYSNSLYTQFSLIYIKTSISVSLFTFFVCKGITSALVASSVFGSFIWFNWLEWRCCLKARLYLQILISSRDRSCWWWWWYSYSRHACSHVLFWSVLVPSFIPYNLWAAKRQQQMEILLLYSGTSLKTKMVSSNSLKEMKLEKILPSQE